MQMTVEKYESRGVSDGKGEFTVTSEQKVGGMVTSEFNAPDDYITAAVGGGYTNQWSPDFLQIGLGKDHFFARFYFDKRVAVDIDDPESIIANRKRKLLFENGHGYLCIPPNFPQDATRLRSLYHAAVSEYRAYEALHPREPVYQEVMQDVGDGQPARKLKIRAIDIKVGGGLSISPQDQQSVKSTVELSKTEMALEKERARVMEALRDCSKRGQPFRNPFIKKDGKRTRLFNVDYGTHS